jgi:hypothetical protein
MRERIGGQRAACAAAGVALFAACSGGAIYERDLSLADRAIPADVSAAPDDAGADLQSPRDAARTPDLVALDATEPADLATFDGAGAMAGEPCGTSAGGAICAGGLVCCYPCGIPNCQWRCQAPCAAGPTCVNGCPLVP